MGVRRREITMVVDDAELWVVPDLPTERKRQQGPKRIGRQVASVEASGAATAGRAWVTTALGVLTICVGAVVGFHYVRGIPNALGAENEAREAATIADKSAEKFGGVAPGPVRLVSAPAQSDVAIYSAQRAAAAEPPLATRPAARNAAVQVADPPKRRAPTQPQPRPIAPSVTPMAAGPSNGGRIVEKPERTANAALPADLDRSQQAAQAARSAISNSL
jgi:hypothetical protein